MRRVSLILVAMVAAGSVLAGQQRPASSPADEAGSVHVLPVRDNVYMLAGPDGVNSVASIGDDGVLVVDTMTEAAAPAVIAAVRTLSPRAIRWVINTSSHIEHAGGNAVVAQAGKYISSGNTRGGTGASIFAFQEAMMRLNGSAKSPDSIAPEGWPTDSFFVKQKDMFFNGEAVQLLHQPAASTDGDTLVVFRRSDVIATGDAFTPQRFPVLDLAEGGSINGYIAGLNRILELTVPALNQEGGTMVVPGHGHLCDEADVADYRDMVTIVRDRVQDLVKKRMTLEQAKAAKPTFDYDGVYATAEFTGDMFVEAVYKSLAQDGKAAAPAAGPRK